MCGGTPWIPAADINEWGLSPRVRGNLVPQGRECGQRRSIPACAGEPPPASAPPAGAGVYPRVCGGTPPCPLSAASPAGLSPRVRGNLGVARRRPRQLRSIPACAGEPPGQIHHSERHQVYPRVCGGTICGRRPTQTTQGLSPRVRGNPGNSRSVKICHRSIPACAGEPGLGCGSQCDAGVYPRVCGGTSSSPSSSLASAGLSPRVRGNPAWGGKRLDMVGSIPACAGEPGVGRQAAGHGWVYPRVCGGTPLRWPPYPPARGLSPRVRGNPPPPRPKSAGQRSIPACAGEPVRHRLRQARFAVYPRVCGGTSSA